MIKDFIIATLLLACLMKLPFGRFPKTFRWRRYVRNGRPTGVDHAVEERIRHRMEHTLEQLRQEDFKSIRTQFSYVLRPFLTETLLRKGWDFVRLMAGPVVSIGNPTISTGWLTDSARVPIQFRRTKMNMSMQFTKSGSIVGLRFLPQDLGAFGLGSANPWRSPEYDKPDSYDEIDIKLGNRGNKVGATLTLPRITSQCPCVVMLAGSGPCDRDSTLQSAKPLKDLAVGLASQGIASIRFDKVTFTHGKRITKNPSFTLSDEYIEHATAAVDHALQHPRISKKAVFLIGYSLGAVVAPKLSALLPSVAGFILMAAPAQPVYWSAVRQLEYLSKIGSGAPEHDNSHDPGLEELRRAASAAVSPELSTSTPAEKLPFGIGPHYWLDYRHFESIAITKRTMKPVLILQGERDYQVTMEDDFLRWQPAVEGMSNVELRSYPNLNHLFMSGEGPSLPSDYEKPCNIDFAVVEDISSWLLRCTKHAKSIDGKDLCS